MAKPNKGPERVGNNVPSGPGIPVRVESISQEEGNARLAERMLNTVVVPSLEEGDFTRDNTDTQNLSFLNPEKRLRVTIETVQDSQRCRVAVFNTQTNERIAYALSNRPVNINQPLDNEGVAPEQIIPWLKNQGYLE